MRKTLKIVIFDGSLKTTTFINRLAKGLAEKHRVSILGFNYSIEVKVPGVKYVALGSSTNTLQLFIKSLTVSLQTIVTKGNFKAFFSVLKWIINNNKEALKQFNFDAKIALLAPDIVHLQWPSLLPYVQNILEEKSIKVVLSQRGFQNNIRPFVDNENWDYLQKCYPKIDGFHSVSNQIAAKGDLIYNTPDKINAVVYSGFDFNNLPHTKASKSSGVFQILSVGRPHWIKGYEYALEACKMLLDRGFEFHYTIVGALNSEELLYRINQLGVAQHVSLTGKIKTAQVFEKMREASVLLVPSIQEGMPNVVIEAMAVGLLVIATDCGGVKELLNEDCGMIVPVRNPKAIAAAVLELNLLSTSEILKITQEARAKVERQHDMNRMVNDMEALYYKCLQS